MKTSTPESPKPPQPPSFLFIGPPGGGKTEMLLQWPGLAVADCDLNLNGPERHLRDDCKLPLSYKYETIPLDSDGKRIDRGDLWQRVVSWVNEVIKDDSIRVAAIDGLTQLNQYLIWHVLKQQGKPNGTMEIQDWVPFRSELMRVIMGLRLSGKWTILTCHETVEYDKKGYIERYKPALSTNLKDYFGGLFTDMWRFSSAPTTGNRQTFSVRPYATTTSELKNSFGIPSKDIELPPGKGFETINKWVKFK